MSSSLTSSTGQHISSIVKPTSKYNVLSNGLRQITPGSVVCSMFCGGKGCKYDNPSKWSESQMAIKGLYSSWVTDNILATSRPSTEAIDKFDIIHQFQKTGINSIINLQTSGEHASCGNALESSGFSYEPEAFMQEDIFFYNFGWDDYGVRALPSILDMVKVMDFAVQEGKVAVHCHAGLGRTGVLIACYLIFSRRMDADHAIHYVREKRTGAIQTKGQMECCQQFAQFLIPLRVVFASCDPCAFPFTLEQYLNRQRYMLHGNEERRLKRIPKIISLVCQRLLQLAAREPDSSSKQSAESYDIRQTHPKAFDNIRKDSVDTNATDQTSRSQDDSDGIQMRKNPPPLRILQRKSSSLEELVKRSSNEKSRQGAGSRESSNENYSDDNEHSNKRTSPDSNRSDQKLLSPSSTSRSSLTSASSRSSSVFRRSQYSRSQFILSDACNLDDDSCVDEVYIVAKALAFDIELEGGDAEKMSVVEGLKQRVESLQMNLNAHNNTWNILATEEDPFVLSCLMWSWLHHLKEPVLSPKDVEYLCDNTKDALKALNSLAKGLKSTVLCIVHVLACLQPLCQKLEKPILSQIVSGLTHNSTDYQLGDFIMEVVRTLEKSSPGKVTEREKNVKAEEDDDEKEEKDLEVTEEENVNRNMEQKKNMRMRLNTKLPTML